ncbi:MULTISPECIES: cytochrome P450 [unclassified Mesorhizobium]|uniref:cytochrome P450 n=1 Tax=unclassified Mesorhizobium TaxID=325217 RepID=UPI000FDB47FE|nr:MULTISPECIES: cytochrome P450 [unclassified Mesorhizobium]TGR23005.1 cytochrome P450 [Mesorhizobium sp. M8A.F.Ca.ET.197.01.1.1]TGR39090.1 cytochrome P450 [bacterium M00.F.Ca.ET.199.01.1.1]TGR46684.1 cytochrome P450 [Mesorhizobium sp. M8A.F.Ca.ET.198.01.1.1]TGV85242.1 cytochrome P450 [Mesorhizobium sp. M00.F.Ca.ET.149.01.1.1]
MSIVWDPFDEAFVHNPWSAYRQLRHEQPVYYNEERKLYALSRFDDVVEANRDWKTFSSASGADLDNTGKIFFGEGNIVEIDPPDHTVFRSVLKNHMTPTFFREREPSTIELVDGLVERLKGTESVDIAAQFSTQLPLSVVFEILGIDRSKRDWVYDRFMGMFYREAGSEEIPESSQKAGRDVRGLLADELKMRRTEPRGDILSSIAHGVKGDVPLTEVEQVGMATLVIAAGISTTKNLLSSIFWYLAQDPSLRQQVQASPENTQTMVEEFLRFDSPIQNMGRTTTRDVELHGTVIPEGSTVALIYGSANRDETQFSDPDRIDLTRRIGRHMAFGGGMHLCLGAPLARLEAKVVLQHALPKLPAFALDGKSERSLKNNERGFEALPIKFEAW